MFAAFQVSLADRRKLDHGFSRGPCRLNPDMALPAHKGAKGVFVEIAEKNQSLPEGGAMEQWRLSASGCWAALYCDSGTHQRPTS